MLGIDYDVVNRESDLTSYAYLVSSVMAADDDGSSGADYIDLLEKCGYKDKGTLLIDGVTFYKYENSQYNTTVEFGISDSLNATIVTVF